MTSKNTSTPKVREFIPVQGNTMCCLISSFRSMPPTDVLQKTIVQIIQNNVVFRYLLLNYLQDIYDITYFPNNLPYTDDLKEFYNQIIKQNGIDENKFPEKEFNELAKIAKKDTELFIKSRDEIWQCHDNEKTEMLMALNTVDTQVCN